MLGNFFDDEKGILTIILMGFPCSWNSCQHCYFDDEATSDEFILLRENKKILSKSSEIIETKEINLIKIFNGGSFFELPKELFPLFRTIFQYKEISIESRPEFITKSSIKSLMNELNPKFLNVFIGFDSFSEKIRNTVFNKNIPQSEITRMASMKIKNVSFYSYVVFGIEGISEASVKRSVEKFNSLFKGVTAIEYRYRPRLRLNHQIISESLKNWLKSNCLNVDFIGNDDEQWAILK